MKSHLLWDKKEVTSVSASTRTCCVCVGKFLTSLSLSFVIKKIRRINNSINLRRLLGELDEIVHAELSAGHQQMALVALFRIRTSTVLYKEEYLAVRSRGRNDTVFCKAREDGVSLTRAADVAGGSAVHAGDTTAKTAGASALGCRSAGLHFRIFVKMFSSAELSSFSKCVLGLSSRGWARWRRACVLLSGTWAMLVGGSETGRTGHSEGGDMAWTQESD